MANAYRRGDLVKYEGDLSRFRGTWWTVKQVNRTRTGRVYDYTLEIEGIGRLHHVTPSHVNQNRRDTEC